MTVFRVWLYRRAQAQVCVEAASTADAQQMAIGLVTESDWDTGLIVPDVPVVVKEPTDRYWSAETKGWVYPPTTIFDQQGER